MFEFVQIIQPYLVGPLVERFQAGSSLVEGPVLLHGKLLRFMAELEFLAFADRVAGILDAEFLVDGVEPRADLGKLLDVAR